MPRRRRPESREILPDPVYNSTLAEKFVNSMMWDGKKAISQKIFYTAMKTIEERTQDDPLKLFKKAVENCKPVLEVKTRRVGGGNYQVPVEVNPFRKQSLAIHWLVLYSRTGTGKTLTDKLAEEIMDAANGRGGAVKKKEDVHRMAEAN